MSIASAVHTSDKISVLRQHEAECYQIAYYLLQNNKLAESAAMQTLKMIYNEDEFFAGSKVVQKEYLKKWTIKQCLSTMAAEGVKKHAV